MMKNFVCVYSFLLCFLNVSLVMASSDEENASAEFEIADFGFGELKISSQISKIHGLTFIFAFINSSPVGRRLLNRLKNLYEEYRKRHPDSFIIIELGTVGEITFCSTTSSPPAKKEEVDVSEQEVEIALLKNQEYLLLSKQHSQLLIFEESQKKTMDYKTYINKKNAFIKEIKDTFGAKTNKNKINEKILERFPIVRKLNELIEKMSAVTEQMALIEQKTRKSLKVKLSGPESEIKKDFNIKITLPAKNSAFASAGMIYTGGVNAVAVSAILLSEESGIPCMYFHELLHLKHFLEEQIEPQSDISYSSEDSIALIPYTNAKMYDSSSVNPGIRDLICELPEVKNRAKTGAEVPWNSLEERRTVCGPDKDGICEMAFEISLELPARYMYEDENGYLEDSNAYFNVVNKVIDSWNKKNECPISDVIVVHGSASLKKNNTPEILRQYILPNVEVRSGKFFAADLCNILHFSTG
jgi:hypothetical protein